MKLTTNSISIKTLIMFGIYVMFFTILVSYVVIPNEYRTVTKQINYTLTVDAPADSLFELMADIKKYPEIFPRNYVSVLIESQNSTVIQSTETIQELGFSESMHVRHVFAPLSHEIIVLDGAAKNTHITITFEDLGMQTTLNINGEMHATGKLIPFAYLPNTNINHAINTIINQFLHHLHS